MSDFAIEAEGLGKRYLLGEDAAQGRLRRALGGLFPHRDPQKRRELWALRDASFAIAQGEAVGIIGRNGAGKSTLLKLLSRITPPTEGRARVRGRIGTLLEVGTGFHPELTGRDNIFLSGTILGMTYGEVARKFDEIVAFSEVGEFIDTPVKRYSSGMYVRLAFAVAAFLEPSILILDEVLAVGDAGFQRKSLGRLNEVSHRDGRTVLFVSHNLQAIRTFCRRVLLLEQGRLVFDGPTEAGIERYLRSLPVRLDVRDTGKKDRLNRTNGDARFTAVAATDSAGRSTWSFAQGEDIRLRFDYEVMQPIPDLYFLIQLRSAADGSLITTIREALSPDPLAAGYCNAFELVLPRIPLRPGEFSLYACLGRGDDRVYYDVIDANVDLPYLIVTSTSAEKYERQGLISLNHEIHKAKSFHGATSS